jgi:putative autotransporter adhesin-like protein
MWTGICKAGRVIAGAALLALAGCGLIGVDGNGMRVTEVRALEGFSAVDSEGSLDVVIVRGDAFHVEVSIDSNLLEMVRTRVAGDTLAIDTDGPIGDVVAGPHVVVTMPVLRRAAVNGSGGLWAGRFDQDEPVSLAIDGSGELTFVGDVPRAEVEISGSGDARLQGTAAVLGVAVDGSGAVDARNLDATSADLSVSGSGDLAATVSGSVRVTVSGSGSVDLYGDAVLERVDVSGSGSIRRH